MSVADPALHGFLNVFKEAGFTSHDVVARVRRIVGARKVGHAGTLDPSALGVLPVCIGRATRLVDYLGDADKGYYAEITLGVQTTTDDAEGGVLTEAGVPPLSPEDLVSALTSFEGRIAQRPPAYSAIKVGGQRAYQAARSGKDLDLPARQVTVFSIAFHWWRPPVLAVTIACSKGTYIRSIARDLGGELGCGGHLSRLVRLWVGSFQLADALSIDEIRAGTDAGQLRSLVLPPDVVLLALPAIVVGSDRESDIRYGRQWPMGPDVLGGTGHARVYDTGGNLLGVVEALAEERLWQPRVGFSGA